MLSEGRGGDCSCAPSLPSQSPQALPRSPHVWALGSAACPSFLSHSSRLCPRRDSLATSSAAVQPPLFGSHLSPAAGPPEGPCQVPLAFPGLRSAPGHTSRPSGRPCSPAGVSGVFPPLPSLFSLYEELLELENACLLREAIGRLLGGWPGLTPPLGSPAACPLPFTLPPVGDVPPGCTKICSHLLLDWP